MEFGPVPLSASGEVARASSIAALRARTEHTLPVLVAGYHGAFAGGGGVFDPDPADTGPSASADDGFRVIVSADGTRYKRRLDGTALRAVDAGWRADAAGWTAGSLVSGVTDNAPVLARLKAAAAATGIREIVLPKGEAFVDATFTPDAQGLIVTGAGKWATRLVTNLGGQVSASAPQTAQALFQTAPFAFIAGEGQYYSNGATQGFTLRGLSLLRPETFIGPGTVGGGREGIALMDNGAGNVVLEDVDAAGFQYGFALPYGGDFGDTSRFSAHACDVGLYVGPGSDQCVFENIELFSCVEAVVTEGAQLTLRSCWFIDAVSAHARLLGNNTSRFGIPVPNHRLESPVLFDTCWFELGAGYVDPNVERPDAWVDVQGAAAGGSLPRNVIIRSPCIVGGSETFPSVFVRMGAGMNIEITDPVVQSFGFSALVDNPHGRSVTVRRRVIVDGYPSFPVFAQLRGNSVYEAATGHIVGFPAKVVLGRQGTSDTLEVVEQGDTGTALFRSTIGGTQRNAVLDFINRTFVIDGVAIGAGAASVKATLSRWLPASGTTAGSVAGMAAFASAGTISHPAPASTNDVTARYRTVVDSGTSASAVAEIRAPSLTLSRAQGFAVEIDFALLNNTDELQFFAGLTKDTGGYGLSALVGEPSAVFFESAGLAINFGDATTDAWFFQHNDASGGATRVNTGVAKSTTVPLRLRLSCARGGAAISVALSNLATGASLYTASLTTDLPASATLLAPRVCARTVSGGAGNAAQFALYRVEIYEA